MDAVIQTQIEKHQKAIKLLELINECDVRIAGHQKYDCEIDFHYSRIKINIKIKQRLTNYYNNNFKL